MLLCICGWLVERLLTIEGMLENDCGVGREWSLEEHSAENDRIFEKKKNKNDRTHMMIASTKMIRINRCLVWNHPSSSSSVSVSRCPREIAFAQCLPVL